MLRTRRPLLALLLLGVLLAAGYLLSAVRSDGPGGTSAPASTTGSTVDPGEGASAGSGDGSGPGDGSEKSGGAGPTPGPSAGRTPTRIPVRPGGGLDTVRAADLPAEARRVLRLIDAGGPFPYAKDGAVFGNVERLLPAQQRGWYREYTVPTPGEDDRGARRIVAGRDGARYYTADHYDSFVRVEDP